MRTAGCRHRRRSPGGTDKTKAKIPRAQASSAGKPDNVFAVNRWCFRKAADVPEAYANVLAKMKKAGVKSCP
jgi:hypothetical protein